MKTSLPLLLVCLGTKALAQTSFDAKEPDR